MPLGTTFPTGWTKMISSSSPTPSDPKYVVLSIILPGRKRTCAQGKENEELNADFCVTRLSQTVEEHNRARGAGEIDEDRNFEDIVYGRVGTKDERIHADYIGQSGLGDIRTLSHKKTLPSGRLWAPNSALLTTRCSQSARKSSPLSSCASRMASAESTGLACSTSRSSAPEVSARTDSSKLCSTPGPSVACRSSPAS